MPSQCCRKGISKIATKGGKYYVIERELLACGMYVHANKNVLDAAHPNPASMIKSLLNLPSTNMENNKIC